MGYFDSISLAQVSAPDEPTIDDDGVPDPEISNSDQEDILVFSIYLGVPKPEGGDVKSSELFSEIGCADCHLPTIDPTIGAIMLIRIYIRYG